MTFFLEGIWVWVGIAFVVGCVGYAAFANDRKPRTLGVGGLAVALILILGFSLVYFVDTDRKSVRRMLDALIVAIENDEVDRVVKDFISPKAENSIRLARANMLLVKISNAKYRDLKISVNNLTSPPVVQTEFSGVFYWKLKSPVDGFSFDTPQLQIVRFNVELEKTEDNSWRVTDNLQFDPKAVP